MTDAYGTELSSRVMFSTIADWREYCHNTHVRTHESITGQVDWLGCYILYHQVGRRQRRLHQEVTACFVQSLLVLLSLPAVSFRE
jgi:hypothetical protein